MSHTLRAPVALFDYLRGEEGREVRHEYVGGEVHAMVGGTLRHNRIALNITRILADRLDGSPCQVFSEGVKLHVRAADCVYYPDVLVYRGSTVADDTNVLQDATLVVEVSSESTAETDRREKLATYRRLPGLRGYWIVSQTEQRVQAHARDASGRWHAVDVVRNGELATDWLDGDALAISRFYVGTNVA